MKILKPKDVLIALEARIERVILKSFAFAAFWPRIHNLTKQKNIFCQNIYDLEDFYSAIPSVEKLSGLTL